MTTIRELRCSDLLEITHMTMGQGNTGPLRDFMSIMMKFPEYSLVCVSPGNRITGFIAGCNTGKGVDRHCEINEFVSVTQTSFECYSRQLRRELRRIVARYFMWK
ncbi:uncharacterized protein LOC113361326 isoform X2 [Papaver somniferum]|uniref:uncharacterized protein LOC113361326 isoform X2 n=1 Tax=Papaver somniferum TaxID=3469 RepID=UPI000E6F6280|nr:uncharacterized protein LOC113361326 isoform X2 [Papaver somniferum]